MVFGPHPAVLRLISGYVLEITPARLREVYGVLEIEFMSAAYKTSACPTVPHFWSLNATFLMYFKIIIK